MSNIRKGFTLIEVAVVLVVVAILAAIAIPTFATFMDGVAADAIQADADAFERNATAVDALDGNYDGLTQGQIDALVAESPRASNVAGVVTFTGDRGQTATVTITVK